MVGTMMLIEDTNGDVEDLALYNFELNLTENPKKWLPKGTILIIKEPYLKYGSMGSNITIRCDSPSDVIFLDETDKRLKEFGWMKKSSEDTFDKLKEKANNLYNKKEFEKALVYYNRAFDLERNPTIYLNRAAAYL